MTRDTAGEALYALARQLDYWASDPVIPGQARRVKQAMHEIAAEARVSLSIYLPPIPRKRALVRQESAS